MPRPSSQIKRSTTKPSPAACLKIGDHVLRVIDTGPQYSDAGEGVNDGGKTGGHAFLGYRLPVNLDSGLTEAVLQVAVGMMVFCPQSEQAEASTLEGQILGGVALLLLSIVMAFAV